MRTVDGGEDRGAAAPRAARAARALERHDGGGGVGSIAMASDGGAVVVGRQPARWRRRGSRRRQGDGGAVLTCAARPPRIGPAGRRRRRPRTSSRRGRCSPARRLRSPSFSAPDAEPAPRVCPLRQLPVGAATAVALSPDGRLAVLGHRRRIARVVELRRGKCSRARLAARDDRRRRVRPRRPLGPDARQRATGGDAVAAAIGRGVTRVWTAESPVTLRRQFGGGARVRARRSRRLSRRGAGVFLLDAASGELRQSGSDKRRRSWTLPMVSAGAASSSPPPRRRPTATTGRTVASSRCWTATCKGSRRIVDLGRTRAGASPVVPRVTDRGPVLITPGADEPPVCTRSSSATARPSCPRPGSNALPLAFMPDGASVRMSVGGALQRVGFPTAG